MDNLHASVPSEIAEDRRILWVQIYSGGWSCKFYWLRKDINHQIVGLKSTVENGLDKVKPWEMCESRGLVKRWVYVYSTIGWLARFFGNWNISVVSALNFWYPSISAPSMKSTKAPVAKPAKVAKPVAPAKKPPAKKAAPDVCRWTSTITQREIHEEEDHNGSLNPLEGSKSKLKRNCTVN